jgi:hypothetical protein
MTGRQAGPHRDPRAVLLLALIAGASAVGTADAGAQAIVRCTDSNGRVVYQSKPCDGQGGGRPVDVTNATSSGKVDPPAEPVPVPVPAAKAATKANAPATTGLPATPPAIARGRLDGYPKEGFGLREGMLPAQVVRVWGRPHEVTVFSARATFFDYCDWRVAMFWDGKLASWSALFADSKRGVSLFRYAEPWIGGPQTWGVERRRYTYMHDVNDRGDVQFWSGQRWIVTDTHGNIVSWCDADVSRPDTAPPTRRTPWE